MFGPPQGVTLASTCSWIDRQVSGLQYATKLAQLRLAFASAPVLNTLTSLHIITRRPVLQKVRDHTGLPRSALSACKHMVSGSISLPSRGSFQLSLTVLYAIGHLVVFSLRRWSSRIHTGFLVSCATLDTNCYNFHFAYETITLFCLVFQQCSTMKIKYVC